MTPRQKAKANGDKFYTDPKPCSKGHTDVVRYSSTGACTQCNVEYQRKARALKLKGVKRVVIELPEDKVGAHAEVVKQLGGKIV